MQFTRQIPPEQTSLPLQTVAQLPQWAESDVKSLHVPLQSKKPAWQT
jgi:hypothetical protein